MSARLVTRAIIVDDRGRVLLAKRANGTAHGRWALIGGKPEADETPDETVMREVFEETGLVFQPRLFRVETDAVSVPGEVWRVSYFIGPATGELELQSENSEARWLGLDELKRLDVAFGHVEVIEQALKN